MRPVKSVRTQLGELLAADATTLAPALAANKIALIAAPYVFDENMVIGDLTLATFTGSTPKSGATGTQQAGLDPATGDQLVTITPPAGGWRWECTAAPATPETIYGAALTNDAGTTLLGVMTLLDAITVAGVGDEVNLGKVDMRINAVPIS